MCYFYPLKMSFEKWSEGEVQEMSVIHGKQTANLVYPNNEYFKIFKKPKTGFPLLLWTPPSPIQPSYLTFVERT